MSQLSIGIIETIGLAAAIEAADVCLKSANVTLIGYELTRGNGMTVVKIEGNVGAVKAAIEAASVAINKVSKVYSKKVIPRPSDSIDPLIRNDNTVGYEKKNIDNKVEEVEELSPLDDLDDIDKQQISNVPNLDMDEENKIDDENDVNEVEDIEENDEEELENDSKDEEMDKEQEVEDDDFGRTYTCNLCKDPNCPRVKGDLKIACIHYDEKKDN